jgi:hypothetical protein
MEKNPAHERNGEGDHPEYRILPLFDPAGPLGFGGFTGLQGDDRDEPDQQADHGGDPLFRNQGNRLQKPDDRPANLGGAGGGHENERPENHRQKPAADQNPFVNPLPGRRECPGRRDRRSRNREGPRREHEGQKQEQIPDVPKNGRKRHMKDAKCGENEQKKHPEAGEIGPEAAETDEDQGGQFGARVEPMKRRPAGPVSESGQLSHDSSGNPCREDQGSRTPKASIPFTAASGGSVPKDAAGTHHHQAVGMAEHLFKIVGRQQKGVAGAMQGEDLRQHIPHPRIIEVGKGLVQNQDAGAHGENAGDGHPPLLPARQQVGTPVGQTGHAHGGQGRGDPFVNLGTVEAKILRAEGHIVVDRLPTIWLSAS